MNDCLFCKIARKKIPKEFAYEDELMVVFKDINPKAPFHLLIVPKKHITSLATLEKEDEILVGKMLYQIRILAEDFGIAEKGFKTVINSGKEGGQIINHLHIHLLGGKKLIYP